MPIWDTKKHAQTHAFTIHPSTQRSLIVYNCSHFPTVSNLFRKMEGQNFLHSIVVYTHVHRFSLRLTPVKGPLITQWPVTVILYGSLVILRATTSMQQNAQHIYLLSLLIALKVLQTTNTQQLSSVTKALNHCNCHWVTGGPLTGVNLDGNRCTWV